MLLRNAVTNLLRQKASLVLTTLSIVLGTAFVAGAVLLGNSINGGFQSLFEGSYAPTAVVVNGAEPETDAERPTLPLDATLAAVTTVPGVAAAAPVSSTLGVLLDDAQEALTTFAPTFVDGTDYTSPLFTDTFRDGVPPAEPGDVVVDALTADDNGLALGDTVFVITEAALGEEFTIVGITEFATDASAGGSIQLYFELETAMRLAGHPGEVDEIRVAAADPEADEAALAGAVQASLDASPDIRPTEVRTKQAVIEDLNADIAVFSQFLSIGVGAFGVISVLVGMFVIYNTFAVRVAQRSRELALMRLVGASQGQLFRSLLMESVVLGLFASALGYVAGYGMALGLLKLFTVIGLDLPSQQPGFSLGLLIGIMILGLVVTVLSTLLPARRAMRTPPIDALRDASLVDARRARVWRLPVGLGLFVAGVAGTLSGLYGGPGVYAAPAGVALLVGLVMLLPFLVTPIVRAAGALFRRFGIIGRLARDNTLRNPRRMSVTAFPVLFGVLLVSLASVIAAGLKGGFDKIGDDLFAADLSVQSTAGIPLPGDAVERVREAPGIGSADAVYFGAITIDTGTEVTGDQFYAGNTQTNIDALAGYPDNKIVGADLGALALDEITISEILAEDLALGAGDTVTATWSDGTRSELNVVGIFDKDYATATTNLAMTAETALAHDPEAAIFFLYADVEADLDAAGLEAFADQAKDDLSAAGLFGVSVQTRDEAISQATGFVDGLLSGVYAMLTLVVVVGILGIVNTLVLAILDRKRELGTMRSVGLTRRQAKRMLKGEAVLVSFAGAVAGLVIGVGIGLLMLASPSFRDTGFFVVAIDPTLPVTILVFAVIVGLVAALMPGRRAARTNIVESIQYE